MHIRTHPYLNTICTTEKPTLKTKIQHELTYTSNAITKIRVFRKSGTKEWELKKKLLLTSKLPRIWTFPVGTRDFFVFLSVCISNAMMTKKVDKREEWNLIVIQSCYPQETIDRGANHLIKRKQWSWQHRMQQKFRKRKKRGRIQLKP